ncbi:TLDc domain-containing protein [Entamoeba marina]
MGGCVTFKKSNVDYRAENKKNDNLMDVNVQFDCSELESSYQLTEDNSSTDVWKMEKDHKNSGLYSDLEKRYIKQLNQENKSYIKHNNCLNKFANALGYKRLPWNTKINNSTSPNDVVDIYKCLNIELLENALMSFCLLESCSLQYPKILFNSNYDGFTTRDFNAKVSCKQNVFFIMKTTCGKCICCYQQGTTPSPTKFLSTQSNSDGLMIVALDNGKCDVFERVNLENKKGLVFYPNTDKDMVVSCNSAFWIRSNQNLFIHQNLIYAFNVTPSSFLFSSSGLPLHFHLDVFVVIAV